MLFQNISFCQTFVPELSNIFYKKYLINVKRMLSDFTWYADYYFNVNNGGISKKQAFSENSV